MALGLAFTALTLCAEYNMLASWAKIDDWGAILDVTPTMNTYLWILTIVSILVNLIPAFIEVRKKIIGSIIKVQDIF